jgi:hypothetical protein
MIDKVTIQYTIDTPPETQEQQEDGVAVYVELPEALLEYPPAMREVYEQAG